MRTVVVAGLAASLLAAPVTAETLSGTIYDTSHAVIVAARVVLEPLGVSGRRLEATTDQVGTFTIDGVDPAVRYRLTVNAPGFGQHAREILGSTGRPLSITLQPEGLAEQVNVVASAYVPRENASAMRTETPLVESPQSISVISSAQIEERDAQNIQEVVSYSAGVRADPYGVDNRNDWFILRGSGDTIAVVDGLRAPLVGYWGGRQEPFAFEQVDVLRGPSSILVGQSGPGGVVNMLTKQPKPFGAREVTVQLGTRSQVEASADLTGPLNTSGTVLYRLFGLVRNADAQVDLAKDDRRFGGGALSFRPDARTSLTAYANFLREDNQSTVGFFPWSGMLLPAPFGPIAPERFLNVVHHGVRRAHDEPGRARRGPPGLGLDAPHAARRDGRGLALGRHSFP